MYKIYILNSWNLDCNSGFHGVLQKNNDRFISFFNCRMIIAL